MFASHIGATLGRVWSKREHAHFEHCVFDLISGVGYGMMIVSAYVGIYYNVIIMYTLYYMFASFTSVLPWVGCGQLWNTPLCANLVQDCLGSGGIMTFNNT